MRNNPEIEFYQSDAVHTVLKRYEFSESEKQIVQDAILSANLDTPNMKAVEKADALLKMVTSSREAIEQEEHIDHKGIAKAVAHSNMKKYKAPQSAWTKPIKSNRSPYSLHYRILTGVIIVGIIYYSMNRHDKYTIDEAREICQKKNEVLPLTVDDFIESNYTFRQPSLFWRADGKVMISNTWEEYTAVEDVGYRFICVPKNGHIGVYSYMYSGTR